MARIKIKNLYNIGICKKTYYYNNDKKIPHWEMTWFYNGITEIDYAIAIFKSFSKCDIPDTAIKGRLIYKRRFETEEKKKWFKQEWTSFVISRVKTEIKED